jgi:FkbM family methyltransferase
MPQNFYQFKNRVEIPLSSLFYGRVSFTPRWELRMQLPIRISEHTFLPDLIATNSVVVDLGMNFGAFTRAVTQRFGCRVIGVEPNPTLAERNRSAGLACRHMAIAARNGEAAFCIDTNDSRASRLAGGTHSATDTVMVTTRTLHDFMSHEKLDRVSLLKMDIEGAELEVFEGEPLDFFDKFDQISVEFHAFAFKDHTPRVRSILDRFTMGGFVCYDFSVSLMDVLLVNTRRRPINWFDRSAMSAVKYVNGARRRLGLSP